MTAARDYPLTLTAPHASPSVVVPVISVFQTVNTQPSRAPA